MATNNVINKNNNIIAGQLALYTPQVNCTGDGTIFKIPWDNGDYDNNSGFDIPTRSFIAPIAGAYLLKLEVFFPIEESNRRKVTHIEKKR